MGKEKKLNPRQKLFVRNLLMGHGKSESAVLAGYSPRSADSSARALLKNNLIVEALDKAGLSDRAIAESLKIGIEAGLGVKASNSDSIRGLELASRLKGHLGRNEDSQGGNQTNIYIKELKQLDDEALKARLDLLTQEIGELKDS